MVSEEERGRNAGFELAKMKVERIIKENDNNRTCFYWHEDYCAYPYGKCKFLENDKCTAKDNDLISLEEMELEAKKYEC